MESLYPAQDMRAREGCCKPLYGWRSPYTCFAELHTHNLQAAGSVGGRVRARARRHPRLQARALPSMAQARGARAGAPAQCPRPAARAPCPPSAGGA